MLIAIILLLLGLFGIISFTVAVGLALAWLSVAAVGIGFLQSRAARMPRQTGVETMIGSSAPAITNIDRDGQIKVGSEIWNARSTGSTIAAGTSARIVRIEGLLAFVEPAEAATNAAPS